MPTYCWKCPSCGNRIETDSKFPPMCPGCMGDPWMKDIHPSAYEMKRDYQAEGAVSTFHPTVDLYQRKLVRNNNKGKNTE